MSVRAIVPTAVPEHLQRVMGDLELEYFRDHFLNCLYTRVAKFVYLVAVLAYQVIVLPVPE